MSWFEPYQLPRFQFNTPRLDASVPSSFYLGPTTRFTFTGMSGMGSRFGMPPWQPQLPAPPSFIMEQIASQRSQQEAQRRSAMNPVQRFISDVLPGDGDPYAPGEGYQPPPEEDGHDHSAPPSGRPGRWDFLVPGGTGRVEHGGTHGGYPAVDIFAPEGTPIYAPADGVSSPATYSLGGNATTLQGADGRWYYFAHARDPMRGGMVKKGDIIGYAGRTGNARNTPPHLHYAVASHPRYFSERNGSGDIDPDQLYAQPARGYN